MNTSPYFIFFSTGINIWLEPLSSGEEMRANLLPTFEKEFIRVNTVVDCTTDDWEPVEDQRGISAVVVDEVKFLIDDVQDDNKEEKDAGDEDDVSRPVCPEALCVYEETHFQLEKKSPTCMPKGQEFICS